MVSKRNRQLIAQKALNKRQTFGLRKFSFGVASVALSSFLITGVAPSVSAAEETAGATSELVPESSEDAELEATGESNGQESEPEVEGTEPSEEEQPVTEKEPEAEGETSKVVPRAVEEEKETPKDQDKEASGKEEQQVDPNRLGGIQKVQQVADNQFEIEYTTGQKAHMDFYDDNIVRYYIDPTGKFQDVPTPRDPERPAHIAAAPLEKYDTIKVELAETEQNVQMATDAIAVELDKKKGTLKLINKETGEVVLEEVEPMYIGQGNNVHTTQYLKSNADSQYFGGGTQNGRFTHKGQSINIKNENNWTDGGVASPNPFYWSTDGYGVLRNTFSEGKYDFEKTASDEVQTTHNERRFDAFYFVGDKPADIIKSYYEITGAPVVLPEFAHYEGHLNAYNRDYWVPVAQGTSGAVYFEEKGGWYKEYQPDAFNKLSEEQKKGAFRETLNGEPEDGNFPFTARAVVLRYKEHDMPLGWILVNDGYGAGYGQTGSLEGNIQNLAEFSKWAQQYGVQTGLWTQSDLKPIEGIDPLLQRDLIAEVRDALVRVLKTDVAWVGNGYSFGLNGTEDAKEIMAQYGDDARPFIITLDGWGGTQRNGGIWTGDQYGGNWEYIRFHIPTYIGTGLSGQPNMGSDMDGIFSGANPIVNTRDYQWKAFTTLQLNMDGWGYNPKNPFAFDQSTTDLNRSYLKLKSMLVPFAYSLSHEALDGMPPIRAMFLDFPDEAINYTKDVQYQYMYGDSLLVAPIYEATDKSDAKGNDVRNGIVLPAGEKWIDIYTGDVYEGGQVLNNYDAPIWKLPVFVRQGAIIPLNNPNNNVTEIDRTTRTVEFYPGKDASFTLVEDDGVTNAYKDGAVAMTEITSTTSEDGTVTLTIGKTDSHYDGYDDVKNKKAQFNVNMTSEPSSVKLLVGGKEVELKRVDSREAYEEAIKNGESVYFYEAEPNLNQFSTEGSDFYGKDLIKNPVLHVMTTAFDTTTADAQLIIEGYEYSQDKFEALGEETGDATVINIADDAVKPTQIEVSWDAVEDAARYELEVDGVVYTNLTDTSFTHSDLDYLSEHSYRVRAVRADNTTTPWSEMVTKSTPDNPYKEVIRGFNVSVDRPVEGSEPLKNFVDGDENTRYHSKWNQEAIPETMIFKFNKAWTFDKFEYVPRSDKGNGTILGGTVEHSMDGVHWEPFDAEINWDWSDGADRAYFDLGGTTAQYLRITVNKSVNNFVSGQEIYFHHVPGDTGFVIGDITDDGALSNDDLTSFGNYAGQIKADSEFEGYIEKGDVNQNGVIDAYDIYYVLNQIDTKSPKAIEEKEGTLEWVTSQSSAKAGDEITVILHTDGLKNIDAINAAFDVDSDLFEVVGDLQLSDTLKGVDESFSRVRTHTDGHKSVNVIVANRGGSFALNIPAEDLATITLRAKKDIADLKIDGRQMMLVGVVAPTLDDNHKDAIQGIHVSSNRPDQPKEEFKYLVDLDSNTMYHSNYGQSALPTELVFTLPEETVLDYIEYVPRQDVDGGNGTITEATVEYSTDGENWQKLDDAIQWDQNKQVKTYDFNGVTAKYIRLTVTGSKNNFVSGQELFFFGKPVDDTTEQPGQPQEPGDKPDTPEDKPGTPEQPDKPDKDETEKPEGDGEMEDDQKPTWTDQEISDKIHELQNQLKDLLDKVTEDETTPTPDIHIDWTDPEISDEIHELQEQLKDLLGKVNGLPSGDTGTTGDEDIEDTIDDLHHQIGALKDQLAHINGEASDAPIVGPTVEAATTTPTGTQSAITPAASHTDTLPQTGIATLGLGLGLLLTSVGSALSFKKRH
ncbi:MAG: discoidin domain-containing protein [Aerococcus sp.]|nr:discoidin domain-containing protein [Aerococcus sp.]